MPRVTITKKSSTLIYYIEPGSRIMEPGSYIEYFELSISVPVTCALLEFEEVSKCSGIGGDSETP